MSLDETSDEFLTRMQPEVRPGFADELARRLVRQGRRQRRWIGVMVAAILATSSFMLLPDVGAAIQRVIWEIGGMFYTECGTLESCITTSRDLTQARRYDPDAVLKTGVYRIETVLDDLPFSLQLVEDMPGGYVYDGLVHVTREGERFTAQLNWYRSDCEDEACSPAMTLTIVNDPDALLALIPDGSTMDRAPDPNARNLFRGPAGESGLVWCAEDESYYSRGQVLCYRLSGFDPDLGHSRFGMLFLADRLVPVQLYDMGRPVSLGALEAAYPDIAELVAAFVPTWAPPGFEVQPDEVVLGRYSSSAALIWRAESEPEEEGEAGWLTLAIGSWSDDTVMLAKEGTLREVSVGDHPGAVFEPMINLYNESQNQRIYYGLEWRQYGLRYSITWPEDAVTTEDVIRMAASVPETGKLPVPPEQMDDLMRLLIAEVRLPDR